MASGSPTPRDETQAASAPPLSRRQLLHTGLSTAGGLLLGGCYFDGLGQNVSDATGPLNQRLEAWLQSKGTVPEFNRNQIQP
jgi:hypothetical protein